MLGRTSICPVVSLFRVVVLTRLVSSLLGADDTSVDSQQPVKGKKTSKSKAKGDAAKPNTTAEEKQETEIKEDVKANVKEDVKEDDKEDVEPQSTAEEDIKSEKPSAEVERPLTAETEGEVNEEEPEKKKATG